MSLEVGDNMRKPATPYKKLIYEKLVRDIQKQNTERLRYLSVSKYSLLDKCLESGQNLIRTNK